MYPAEVEINAETIERLTETFKKAYISITEEIKTATDFGVANRKAILSQIESTLEKLGVDTQKFIETELTAQYKIGASEAVEQLKNIGADVGVSEGFNRIHTNAIAALVDDASTSFGDSLSGVARSANTIMGKAYREALTQKIAEGMIGGKARKEVTKIIKGTLEQQGLSAITDKGGKNWSLDRYADMLFRTKSVEARNRGMINRMVENDYDLVQVSAHSGTCDLCAPWEGAILSARGLTPGYPTVADAENDGLFHPNCRHAINVLIPSLAKLTKAYGEEEPGEGLLKPYQNITKKALIPKATAYQPVFKGLLEEVSENTGMKWALGPIKGFERTAEKILYDYNGAVYSMKDVNRSVFFISDPTDKKAFSKLVTEVEGKFGKLAAEDIKQGLNVTDGYASSKLSVKTPYGAKAEIQITTPEMWDAKINKGGDKLYHLSRKPATDVVSIKQAKEAEEKMKALYAEATRLTKLRLAS